ncbi:MAG: secretin N-terminal domain-containing protein [Burkholderiales bacterium]
MTLTSFDSRQRRTHRLRAATASVGVFLLLLSGCTGYQAYRDGQARLAEGQTEPGLSKLREAMDSEPSNPDYRRSYFTQRESAVNGLLRDADLALSTGDFAAARLAMDKIARLDPGNERLAPGRDRIAATERHGRMLDAATASAKDGDLQSAISKTQQVLSENPNQRRARPMLRQFQRQQADVTGKELGIYPKLKAAYRVPVSLSFTNASLLQVFEALRQASGLNYMIERDVKPDLRVTLSVTNKPVEDIVRLLLATNQLERRVLDDDTLLIYPSTAAKQAEYREMVVRSFYLSNAEAAKVAAVVRTIAKARDVVVDEKLNMLMVRDSEEVVRLAEKVIASQDLPEPEVMLELEVMEVSVNRLLDIGIQWPTSLSASVIGADGVLGQLRLNELRKGVRNRSMVELNTNTPLASGQFKSQTGDANLLANPRVRVRNKQTAKILIGERVPVITTTSTANVGSSQSISYLDVGLKLEIEPTVSLDDEVSMKVALEVSNITQTITLTGGTQAYRLGTRNTSTSLQVHDGETNILAGLIQRDRSHSNTGVPGLNELPLVNRLFGMAEDSDTRTEIVLLITPHIVRSLDVPGVGQQEFLSGTEAAAGAGPIQLGPTGPGSSRQGAPATPPAPPPRPATTAPILPPRPAGAVPGSSPMPQMPQPSPPQFSPAPVGVQPSAPSASAPAPGLIAPGLVPSPPGS